MSAVLIQPNLRFFHEMFGWEVELVRREMALGSERRRAAEAQGVVDQQELDRLEKEGVRTIMYSWPSFCRDLVSCLLDNGEAGQGLMGFSTA